MGSRLTKAEYRLVIPEAGYWEYFTPYWEYQLQCMVVQDDPVAYLEQFIEKDD